MPRALGHQADRQLLSLIGAAAEILDPQLPSAQVLPDAVVQRIESRGLKRLPPLPKAKKKSTH
jgi:hypothetical protein